jgi:hypothetical protein
MAPSIRTVARRALGPFYRSARRTAARIVAQVRRFYRYYLSKSFFTLTVVRTATVKGSSGVAIVVLYPRGPLLASVTRLIDTLVDEGYLVIAVVNKSRQSTTWLKTLEEKNITLISRPNIGRDFGAYKMGYLFADREGLLTNAQHLIFANDSMYYGPRSQPFVAGLLKEEEPWTAMFVNHHFYTHAQSFFIRFSRELFTQKEFHQFWRSYFPSEGREHAIHQGERKLTETLMQIGYTPSGYVTADRVLSNSAFGDFTQDERYLIQLFSSLYLQPRGVALDSIRQPAIETLMRRQFHALNITHTQGTLVSRVLGAPLKLDIAQRYATPEAVRETLLALGCTHEEAESTLRFIFDLPPIRLASEMLAGGRPGLHDLMKALHGALAPRTYIETGVFKGDSLKLARCAAVGIDPAPQVTQPLPSTAQVISTTGDDFFAQPRPLEEYFRHGGVPTARLVQHPRLLKRWLSGTPRRSDGERFAELALIDGMHHAEFALRDFMNIERNSAPWSVIVFDDVLPENAQQALRARETEAWTGDVFRVEQILKVYRPDLVTVRVDIPTGALVVFAPNYLDRRLDSAYSEIVANYVQSDPQVLPDDVLQRTGALSLDEFLRSGVLDIVRTARKREATSAWVARSVRARLAGL